ncbi:hypothetical protein BCR43DRAFT_103548 [Syncephalastrum racemosum]|uniref:Bud22 domain-containing protein n=1 Tax=Syncephalastrum racemosum TaxID=13706 RepID=A0A1X2H1L2_SYNRA|nr:hypothetical protein BCR43DRAFT_103548 [Syncephalastrum racemosum]
MPDVQPNDNPTQEQDHPEEEQNGEKRLILAKQKLKKLDTLRFHEKKRLTQLCKASRTAEIRKERQKLKQAKGEVENKNDKGKKYGSDLDKKTLDSLQSRVLNQKKVRDEIVVCLNKLESVVKSTSDAASKKRAITDDNAEQKDEQTEQPKKQRRTDTNEGQFDVAASMFVGSLNQESKPRKKTASKKDSTDWIDPNFDAIYNGEVKKNRPGQAARRKKAEELYGEEANHLKKEREKKAEESKYFGKKPQQQKQPLGEDAHPSWAAKRKQQEAMSKALSGDAPSGNKVVFGGETKETAESHPSWAAKRKEQEMMSKALSGQATANSKIVFD